MSNSKLQCFLGGAALAAGADMFSHLVPHDYRGDVVEIVVVGSMFVVYGLTVLLMAIAERLGGPA